MSLLGLFYILTMRVMKYLCVSPTSEEEKQLFVNQLKEMFSSRTTMKTRGVQCV